jgi:chaperonin GroEL
MAEPSFGPPPAISSRDIVAWRIELEDRFANPGVRMARDVGSRTSQATGGETATATVLEQAIVDEGAPTES